MGVIIVGIFNLGWCRYIYLVWWLRCLECFGFGRVCIDLFCLDKIMELVLYIGWQFRAACYSGNDDWYRDGKVDSKEEWGCSCEMDGVRVNP